jgi:hypothetical protein
MSFWDPNYMEEWFRRVTGMSTRRLNWFGWENFPKEFDSMRRAMERIYEQYRDFGTRPPRTLLRNLKHQKA